MVDGPLCERTPRHVSNEPQLMQCSKRHVVTLNVDDIAPSCDAVDRASVRQKKTGRPVKFELAELTRTGKKPGEYLFSGRRGSERSLTARQYARPFSDWLDGIGLDPDLFGTHSLRRTKATLIDRRLAT